jgi:hypothetical protein
MHASMSVSRSRVVLAVLLFLVAGIAILTSVSACSGWLSRSEGIDPTTLPETIRPEYAVFAARCSKCHSLARPLSSGIDDDDYWAMYVARMRRQPASGISQEDTVVILRFLHYYSEEQKEKKAKHGAPPPPAASALSPAPSPTPASPSALAPTPAPTPTPTSAPTPAPSSMPAPSGSGGGG